MFLLSLCLVAAAGVYFMTPDERTRLVRAAAALYRRVQGEAVRLHARQATTRGETAEPRPRAVATAALAGIILAASLWVALSTGELSRTLLASGANFGPRTTNGEWWRLVTAGFLPVSLLGLLINVAALLQVGFVLERAVGRLPIVTVYLFASVFAGLVNLSTQPLAINTGSASGIFGLYGLLLASWMWGAFAGATPVRLPVVARLAPGGLIFVCYHLAAGELVANARIAGVITGFASGVVLARGARAAAPRRCAAMAAAAAVVAVAFAAPLRGLTDLRPHLAHLVSVEKETTAAYDAHVARFQKGRATVDALSSLIERQIIPQLKAAGAPLNGLNGVPDAQQPLSAAAQRFVQLRVESWQLRLRGLRKASMPILRDADAVESRSRELLRQVVAVQSSAS